ncbi:DUF4347 domain-containing protein [Paraburkholderia terrae]
MSIRGSSPLQLPHLSRERIRPPPHQPRRRPLRKTWSCWIARVENGSELIAKLPTNTRLLVIDPNQDAVSAINSALASIGKVDSIQIFSHGASGQFTLGNQTFTSGNLMQMAAALGAWRNGDRHVSGRSDGQDDHERHRCQTSACRRLVRASRNIRMCRSTIAVREARA